MGVAILSREELQAWLEDKPRTWSQAIALRSALRVLPAAIDNENFQSRRVDPEFAMVLFRTVSVMSGYARAPRDLRAVPGHVSARRSRAIRALRAVRASHASIVAAFVSPDYFSDADFRVGYDAATAAAAAASANAPDRNADAAFIVASAVDASAYAAAAASDTSIWAALSGDCSRLQDGTTPAALIARPLWLERPEWFSRAWGRAAQWLSRSEHGFAIWSEWYFGRLEGLPQAFDRFNASADTAFDRWIIEQDDHWWKRDPANVNADIAAKVEELRHEEGRHPDDLFGKAAKDFFISYSTANEAAAREVAGILDDLGRTYIVQFRDFAQQNFVNAMNDGLAQSERLIALYSPEYMTSGHCLAEWNVFYNRDPSSAQRRIVAFKLEDVDLKPLMKPIVYRDMSRLSGTARQAAIREWITWEPTPPTRAQVEQVVTATLSPQIVETDEGKLDTQPNPAIDQPEYPAELAEALNALGMVLDVVLEETSNLSRPMQKALDGYDQEFTANGAKSSWGGLDRLMAIIAGGLAKMAEAEFADGQREALEQLVAAHDACMAALKNADRRLRELDAIPLDGADQARIKVLVDRLKEFFERLRNLGLTSDRLDRHVDDLVEQGRDFAFEAGEPDADQRPHARRQFLLYAGGFGLAALNALGSMASISAVPLAQEAISAGQAMVEVFFRMVGL